MASPDERPRLEDDCLAGGGEMGALMRSFDWSSTPLGPVRTWPQSLKTAVRIMLHSRYAMWMAWGPALTFFCNDAYRPTLGVKARWALGSRSDKVWEEIWPDIGPRIRTVLETGSATWDERLLLFLERSGYPEETYHTFSYSPLADDGGSITGMLCVVTEDTERVIGERRLRTLRELGLRTSAEARTAEDACAVAARCLSSNPYDIPFALIYLLDGAVARLAGVSGTEPCGHAAPATLDLARADAGRAWPLERVRSTMRPELVTDVVERVGLVALGPWGETPHSALVLPIAQTLQDKLAGFLVAGINSRRVVDEDYRSFLELAAGHVGTTIANARAYEEEKRRAESLAELDRAKTAFFSNVSHEFRTPLTLLLGPVEDLLAEGGDAVSPERRERLEVVHRNALRLQKLVNTLLDFSRIEAGRIQAHFEPTDLAGFTAELAGVFRSAVEKAGMRLIVRCEPLPGPAYVDRDMWEKLVLNLVSNAFKFTLEGEIEVSLQPDGEAAVLRVRDTGIGIEEDQLPHIFERFRRVEGARARTQEGTGIGLALVRELVRVHGGTVEAHSVPGQGSTMMVRIPLGAAHLPAERVGKGPAPAPASTALNAGHFVGEALKWLGEEAAADQPGAVVEPGEAPPRAPGPERRRILLADDNADMRDYLRRLLSPRFDVLALSDGAEALRAAREDPPDLVLTDVMMPRLDGFGLIRELRSDPRTRTIPVVMLSARAGEEARIEGLQSGADDYLIKPFHARELIARVAAAIELARVRREAAVANERAALILESITDGFLALDRQWRITGVNAAAERANGLRRDLLLGREFREAFPATVGTPLETQLRRSLAEKVAVEFENYYEPWGRWFELRVFPSPEGGLSIFFRDITDRKRDAEARQQLLEKLKEADRRKDEFLAMLAHELRNPLAAIANAAQLARLSSVPGHQEWSQGVIAAQVKNLARMIDDLLNVSRITRGKIQLRKEPIRLAAVINSAIEATRPVLEERRHRLILDLTTEPLVVQGDPTRLEQVFVNLLNNAAKYTEPEGQIAVAARCRDGDVVVSVEDNGIGMSAELLASAFDLFTQGDRAIARTEGGLGIGLTVVKSLVELHGGSVQGRSDGPGKGSCFTVRLPLATGRPAADAGGPDPGEGAARRGARVLVVDDNLDTARGLIRLLEIMGHDALMTHDGPSAIVQARAYRPSIVLLDIGLPGMDGYQVARALREDGFDRTLIIAVSGYGEPSTQARSREAGFDHYLVKPVDLEALVSLIGRPG
jgi:PAS domain S-box-containing protein